MTAPDVLSVKVFPRLYRDSVTLMALASVAQRREGVLRVGAVMATPANLTILTEAGMLPDGVSPAPDDLILSVRAGDQAQADAALEAAEAGLTSHDAPGGQTAEVAAQTLREGLALDPDATIATVSTPGTYAPVVVEQALASGLHVFCFSDNVAVADEVRLKEIAVERGRPAHGPGLRHRDRRWGPPRIRARQRRASRTGGDRGRIPGPGPRRSPACSTPPVSGCRRSSAWVDATSPTMSVV